MLYLRSVLTSMMSFWAPQVIKFTPWTITHPSSGKGTTLCELLYIPQEAYVRLILRLAVGPR